MIAPVETMGHQAERCPPVVAVLLNYMSYADTIECIESLDRVSYGDLRVVIVDNDSPNESLDVLQRRYPQHTVMSSGANLGFAGGCNVGIRHALQLGAEFILLLNNDTVVDPGFLAPLIRRLSADETIGMVGGKGLYYYHPDTIWFAGGAFNWITGRGYCLGQNEPDSARWNQPRQVSFLTCAFVLVRRAVFETVGFLCEDFFLGGEEWDFSIRVSRAYRLCYEPASVILHKVTASHEKCTPRYIYNGIRMKLKFMWKHAPTWFHPFWYVAIRLYLEFIAPRKFERLNSCLDRREVIASIGQAIEDEKSHAAITATDLSRIEDSICRLQLVR